MVDLPLEVRREKNLYDAWIAVRARAKKSVASGVEKELAEIEANPTAFLRKLHINLRRNRYQSSKPRGVPVPKAGGGKRGVVMWPLEDRVVQRAILNVLQCSAPRVANALGDIPDILSVETSVGGIPGRGVPEAIRLVRRTIESGARYYLRSDIKSFFTKIPQLEVIDFIEKNTKSKEFCSLISDALGNELSNPDQIKGIEHLFPSGDIGVPQGGSLSALAGNIILSKFDRIMNEGKIVTIRYIDDFVILGRGPAEVMGRFEAGLGVLRDLGMDSYIPDGKSHKSKKGPVRRGFDFLGCRINEDNIGPSRNAQKTILARARSRLNEGEKQINSFSNNQKKRHTDRCFIQTLYDVDRIIGGWGDSFRFCTNRQPFTAIDREISDMIAKFWRTFVQNNKGLSPELKRRRMGVALLADTKGNITISS